MTADNEYDIGAVSNIYRKGVFLTVRRGDCDYTIALGRGQAPVVAVSYRRVGAYGYSRAQLGWRNSDDASQAVLEVTHVLGYVLKRAICRGVDTCEIVETDGAALIDLGVMP